MIPVPVLLSTGGLAVVTQQDHTRGTKVRGQCNGTSAAVFLSRKTNTARILDRGRGNAIPVELSPRFLAVIFPPLHVHRIEDISPRSKPECGVDRYDAAVFLGRFAPRADGFAIVCGETWATGDADCGVPVASMGSRPIETRPRNASAAA